MSRRPTAFIGDAHLLRGEAVTADFVRFLAGAPSRFERLVLVGDIFDLWLARPHLHEEHHVQVLAALARATAEGLPVDYAVGNRDYGVETLPAAPLARVATHLLPEPGDRPAWIAEHGDLVNDADRNYRAWRAFSRSALVLGAFLRLPGPVGVPLSLWVERRLRTTNLAYKRRFPAEHVEAHAARLFETTGARFLVLGHFHEERRLAAGGGEVLVLPDWKRSRRHLEWRPGVARMEFVPSLD